MTHCLFISDLHLSADNPHLNQLFNLFIDNYAPRATALYILGDLFEVWIGDDAATTWSDEIAGKLADLAQKGIKVYIMPGNRDFLLGSEFVKKARCELLTDPSCVTLYDKKILLKHGDDLCTADRQHQWFRRLSRAKLVKTAYLSLPLRFRHALANKIRLISYRRNKSRQANIMDVVPQAINQQLQQHNPDILLHGHTHNPSIHYLWLNNRYYTHLVLSDWGKTGNFLRLNDSGSFALEYFE